MWWLRGRFAGFLFLLADAEVRGLVCGCDEGFFLLEVGVLEFGH